MKPMRYTNNPSTPAMRIKNTVEKLTENAENVTIQVITAKRIKILNGVFFICLSIFSPAEKMR